MRTTRQQQQEPAVSDNSIKNGEKALRPDQIHGNQREEHLTSLG